MRSIIPAVAILIFSCNQGGKKEKDAGSPSLVTRDTLPDLTRNPGADSVNYYLGTKEGGWHVMTDAKSGWTKDALEYFVYPQRRSDPDYPYITRGDYNCDGKPDIAALLTDSAAVRVRLAFLYGGGGEIGWWREDMRGAALKNLVKQDFGAMRDEKEIRVSLECDAVEAEWFEKATQVIYRKGDTLENAWTAD